MASSLPGSTRIEGARLSDHEVETLLTNIHIGAYATRDEQEIDGYAGVMETIFDACDAILLSENHIRQLHRDLLVYSTRDERHHGSYRTIAVHVEAFDVDGEGLVEEFMKSMGLEQSTPAEATGVQRKHVNELCNNRRNVTAATALIPARVFSNSPDFRLNVQRRGDLWDAMR